MEIHDEPVRPSPTWPDLAVTLFDMFFLSSQDKILKFEYYSAIDFKMIVSNFGAKIFISFEIIAFLVILDFCHFFHTFLRISQELLYFLIERINVEIHPLTVP